MRRRVAIWSALAGLALSAGMIAVAEAGETSSNASEAVALAPDLNNPQVVASGLAIPWGLGFLPDGSALVAERNSARVLRLSPGSAPTVVTTVSGVVPGGEGGLLGLAISPTFAQDNFVYVYYTAASDNRITRFRLDAPQTQQVILSGLAKANIHDGGRIAFGPDGMLYAGVGDAGNTASSQNQQSQNGKILRMTPTGGVPASGNPFPNSRVYSLGHRNVQGLAWDAQGRLYASEFGQNTWDEVNLIVAGGNYGWPTVEGMSNDTRFRNPLVVWTTAEASPSGAAIDGNTLYVAALRGQRLWSVPLNGNGGVGTPTALLQGQFGRLRTVERAPDGSLWVATSNRDGRGTPAASDDRVLRFPPIGGPQPTTPGPQPTTPGPQPTTPGPQPTTPGPQPTTPAPQPGGCTATYAVASQWQGGFQADVRVTAGGSAINGWTVTWTYGGGQRVTQSWNATVTSNGSTVTATNVSYNGRLGAGQSTNFGFLGSWTGSNPAPAVSCSAS